MPLSHILPFFSQPTLIAYDFSFSSIQLYLEDGANIKDYSKIITDDSAPNTNDHKRKIIIFAEGNRENMM